MHVLLWLFTVSSKKTLFMKTVESSRSISLTFLDFSLFERYLHFIPCFNTSKIPSLNFILNWSYWTEMEFCTATIVDWLRIWESCWMFQQLGLVKLCFLLMGLPKIESKNNATKRLPKLVISVYSKGTVEKFGVLLWGIQKLRKTQFLFRLEQKLSLRWQSKSLRNFHFTVLWSR